MLIISHFHYSPRPFQPMSNMTHVYCAQCLICYTPIMPHVYYASSTFFSIPGMPHAHHTHSHKAPCPLCPMLIVPHAHYIQCFMCPSMSTSIMAHDNWVIIFPQQSLPHGIRIICSTTFYFVIPFSLFHLISFFMHY